MPSRQTLVLSNTQIEQKISRLAYQIYEDCSEEQELILAGIAPNGYFLAERLMKKLQEISSIQSRLVEIKVANKENPGEHEISLDISNEELKNKVIILADDVLNSGKTLLYSITAFRNISLKKLRIAVLVDRNHKRYPISADFVGISLATTMQEHITVVLNHDNEAVYLS